MDYECNYCRDDCCQLFWFKRGSQNVMVCKECRDELVHGKISLQPVHFTGCRPAGERADMTYHGGRFHSGEW